MFERMILPFVSLLIFGISMKSWTMIIISVILIIALAVIPFEGFKAKSEVERVILLQLKNLDRYGGKRYITKKGNKVCYAYGSNLRYAKGEIKYTEKKIRGKIRIIESENSKYAVMKKYITEPYRDECIALWPNRVEYEFTVPKGTVLDFDSGQKYVVEVV